MNRRTTITTLLLSRAGRRSTSTPAFGHSFGEGLLGLTLVLALVAGFSGDFKDPSTDLTLQRP